MSKRDLKSDLFRDPAKVFLVVSLLLIMALLGGMVFILNGVGVSTTSVSAASANAVSIDSSGKQVINVVAKGGFSPNKVTAKANVDSRLKVSTNNTFDCSSVLYIPALGIQKNLPITGTTEIDIPAQATGTKLHGTCSMGMYSLDIEFS